MSMNAGWQQISWSLASALCFAMMIGAARSDQRVAMPAGQTDQAMSVRYEDLKWQAVVPQLGDDSPQLAILRVDPQTKATQLLIRTPKKMHVPMHWHTANETHTIIRGITTFEHAGKREAPGPGGFNYIPAKMQHQAWMEAESLILITVDGAWDVNWVGDPPGKADLEQSVPID